MGASRDGRRELALLLAVNGLGGWLGAEMAEGLLVPAAGLWGSTVILAGLALVLWLLVAWDHLFRSPAALTGLVGGLAALAAGGLVVQRLPQVAPEPGITLAKVRVSREGVVAAVHGASNDWRIVFNNTYTLGGSRAQFNQERQAHLPILLHAGARSLPEELREAQDSGQFFLTLDIAAKLGLPARGNLEAQIPTRIPTALQDDFQADWRQWPSRVKPFVATGPGTPR